MSAKPSAVEQAIVVEYLAGDQDRVAISGSGPETTSTDQADADFDTVEMSSAMAQLVSFPVWTAYSRQMLDALKSHLEQHNEQAVIGDRRNYVERAAQIAVACPNLKPAHRYGLLSVAMRTIDQMEQRSGINMFTSDDRYADRWQEVVAGGRNQAREDDPLGATLWDVHTRRYALSILGGGAVSLAALWWGISRQHTNVASQPHVATQPLEIDGVATLRGTPVDGGWTVVHDGDAKTRFTFAPVPPDITGKARIDVIGLRDPTTGWATDIGLLRLDKRPGEVRVVMSIPRGARLAVYADRPVSFDSEGRAIRIASQQRGSHVNGYVITTPDPGQYTVPPSAGSFEDERRFGNDGWNPAITQPAINHLRLAATRTSGDSPQIVSLSANRGDGLVAEVVVLVGDQRSAPTQVYVGVRQVVVDGRTLELMDGGPLFETPVASLAGTQNVTYLGDMPLVTLSAVPGHLAPAKVTTSGNDITVSVPQDVTLA